MPLYGFNCECGAYAEIMLSISERDHEMLCPKCSRPMQREIAAPALHGEPYQMQAILGDGSKVKGHFGREAPRRRK